jgi:hypothetical protein
MKKEPIWIRSVYHLHEKASGEFAFPEPRLKLVNAESTELKPDTRGQVQWIPG